MAEQPEHTRETSLIVDDLGRSRRFYQSVFGLDAVIERSDVIGLQLPDNTVLLLFDRSSLPPGYHAGETHLRFGVPASVLPEWDRHLTVHGVVIESRVEDGFGVSSLFFRDPDQHSLEVSAEAA